jgi:hypothetical protein
MVAGMYLTSRISYDSRDAQLSSSKWMPEKVANIDDIIASQRLRQTEPVTDLDKFEVVGQATAGSCEAYLAM